MPAAEDYEKKYELIKQEVEICKYLASNDVKVRRKGVSKLKKFLNNENHETILDTEDFARIWNGLFNYVWMSDKPLVQEADAETISSLIHEINSYDLAVLFLKGFFDSIASHWNRVSHYRTDKFLMFIRRFIRQTFTLLQNLEWNADKMEKFSAEMYSAIQILPFGLTLHLNDIYNEEIAKVTRGNIPTSALILLLKCFVECIVSLKPSMNVINSINANIFASLVKQLKLYIQQKAAASLNSDESCLKDTSEKFDNSNDQENQPDEDEYENFTYDPRPGNVNVFLPYIEFDENMMAEFLEKYISEPRVPRKAKNIIQQIIQMVRSIKRLRETVNIPKNIAQERNEQVSQRKRKRKRAETFSSLIKKSCKKLEEEIPILPIKKMRKLDRVLSTIASNSTRNSAKATTAAADNSWTVTERVDDEEHKSSTNSTPVAANTSQDWTITDLLVVDEKRTPLKSDRDSPNETMTNASCSAKSESQEINNESVNEELKLEQEDVTMTEESDTVTKSANKGKSRVSFATELATHVVYETENYSKSDVDAQETPVVVPSSAVKERTGLLKQGENYSIVDFSSSSNTQDCTAEQNVRQQSSDVPEPVTTLTVSEPVWKISHTDKPSAETAEDDDVISDTDYDLPSLFNTPPKKRYSRRSRCTIVVTEVKRSQRIANKVAAAKVACEKK